MRERDQEVRAWPVSGLEKVLPFALPPGDASGAIELSGAAGEYEVAQIAVRASGGDVELRKPVITALKNSNGETVQADISARFVDLVPVRYPTQGVARGELVAVAPGYFPDPLCLDDRVIVPDGQTRSIWLSFAIPADAVAGRYTGQVTVVTSLGDRTVSVELTVWPFVLPWDIPFAATHWFWPGLMAQYHCVQLYSEPFWSLLEMYAADMQIHRQNVILTQILGADGLIGIARRRDGGYGFDFTDFDRWVEIFLDHGFRFIEGSHFFDTSVEFVRVADEETGEVEIVKRRSDRDGIVEDDEYLAILKAALPALRDHLSEMGWSEHYIQHIFDEPGPAHTETYRYLVKLVRDIWPDLRLVDALGCETSLFEAADIIVPLLGTKRAFEEMPKYKELGKTFWAYTCNWPRGRFPNRYLDQPLIMTRVIPWIFWRYGLTGYLHWAYARWSPHHAHERLRFDPYTGRSADDVELTNPWEDTVLGATWSCPPGDASMVYPPRDPLSNDPLILSPDLPDVFALYLAGIPPEPGTEDTGASVEDRNPRLEGVIDSIRWEQVRESIEDYGLLWMLSERIREAERDPNRAALAEQAQHTLDEVMDDVAPDWLNYTRDPAVISSARGRLAESIASLNTPDGPCGVGS